MRHKKRAFCILIFLSWMRVNSQVIYDSPPVNVALTRPILPWLARYFVGAGKSNIYLDNPQSGNTPADTTSKSTHPSHNGVPMANYVSKSSVRRAEEAEAKPDEAKPDDDKKEEDKPAEEKPADPPAEPPKEEEAKPPPAEQEEAKPDDPPPEPPAPEVTEAPAEITDTDPPEPPAPEVTEAPKEITATNPPQPFVLPPAVPTPVQPTYYYENIFGPATAKTVQGLPAAPPVAAPYYSMPSYIYYPAPLPSYPSAYPYPLPSPLVAQPTFAVPTTPQPVMPVATTYPSLPAPKPIVLETPTLPKGWPLPEPIPITSINLPTVTTVQPILAPIPAPKPIVPMPTFPQIPLFSMPAHSIVPFQSVVPPGSYFGPPCLPPAIPISAASSSIISPKYFYRDIGNAKAPEARRHQVYLQPPPNYKIN